MMCDDLTQGRQEKAKACTAPEEGVELTDGQLQAVSGGSSDESAGAGFKQCPECGGTDISSYFEPQVGYINDCNSCGYSWGS